MRPTLLALPLLAAIAVVAPGGGPPQAAAAISVDRIVDSLRHQIAKERRAWNRSRERLERVNRMLRRENRRLRAGRDLPDAPSSHLRDIALCESGGHPGAISGGGQYRGKYQFDIRTWRSVGGTGDPARAPEVEQDFRAYLLYQRRGSQPWPVCG